MTAVIVPVKENEQLEQCLDIRKEVFVKEQQVPVDLEIDEFDILNENTHHILIEVEGKQAATGRLIFYKDNAAKLQRIAVRQAYRGQGLGAVLIIALEELARDLGLSKSILDAQCQAEGFYHKLGYTTVSTEPFDDAGIPHVRMEKVL
ncbi:putative N-acetyltransferase YjcF [compost metagenome]